MINLIIPLQFIAVLPILNDQTTLLRNALIVIFPLLIATLKYIDLFQYRVIIILFVLTVITFVISALLNNQNWTSVLLGSYGRSDGLLTLIGLYIVFLLSAETNKIERTRMFSIINFTINLTLLFGYLEILGLEPIKWSSEYMGVMLTLANPNFAGAFLGCISVFCIYGIRSSKGFNKYTYLIKYIGLIYLTISTKSSQGFLLILLNLILFGLFEIKTNSVVRKKFLNFKKQIISIIFIITTSSAIMFTTNKELINQISLSLNLFDRIQHWRIALSIWENNKIFGVGIAQLQSHVAEFKTYNDVQRWGDYGHPDRAHNVILDYFANGGIIGGLLYLGFIVIIIICGFKLVAVETNNKVNLLNVTVLIGWLCCITQSLFSPSHILIDSLAFILGGYIYGNYVELAKVTDTKKKFVK